MTPVGTEPHMSMYKQRRGNNDIDRWEDEPLIVCSRLGGRNQVVCLNSSPICLSLPQSDVRRPSYRRAESQSRANWSRIVGQRRICAWCPIPECVMKAQDQDASPRRHCPIPGQVEQCANQSCGHFKWSPPVRPSHWPPGLLINV